MHKKYNNGRWVGQRAELSSLLDLVCDSICQTSNEDESEMKILMASPPTSPRVFIVSLSDNMPFEP